MKKLMKRGVMPLLAFGAVALLSVSCGGTKVVDTDLKNLDAKITWWNNYQKPEINDKLTEEEARKQSKYNEYYYALDLIKEFNKTYPNIEVETTFKGNYAAIQQAVNTGLNGGVVPNIATCYGDHVAGYNKVGATLDMTPYLTDEKMGLGKTMNENAEVVDDPTTAMDDLNMSYFDAEKNMYASKQYLSLPYSKSGEMLSFNQDVFDKVGAGEAGKANGTYVAPVSLASKVAYSVPTNYKDLISTARKMKADYPSLFSDANQKDANGFFKNIPFCYDSGENMFISFSQMMNIPYTKADGSVAEQILFKNDDAKKLVVQLKKWNNEGLMCTQNQLPFSDSQGKYHEYSSNMFVKGNIFMCITSTTGARYFAADSGFKASLVSTPVIDTNCYDGASGTVTTAKSKVLSQGPSLTFFKKSGDNAKQNDASWLFYKFLTDSNNTAKLSVNTSYFPLRKSAYESEGIKKLTSAAETGVTTDSSYNEKVSCYGGTSLKLNESYTNDNRYFISPVFDRSASTRTAVGGLIESIFNNANLKDDAAITTAVDAAFEAAYAAAVNG